MNQPTIINQAGEYRYEFGAGEHALQIIQTPETGEIVVECALQAAGTNLTVENLFVGAGESAQKLTVTIDHQSPLTTARFTGKGILSDTARVDFRGLIKVGPHAKGTNSWLEHRSLLLSPGCQANPLPSLEILTDDVKASHAATVSHLDDEALFYLTSRGLDQDNAASLLTDAFITDLVDHLPPAWQNTIHQLTTAATSR